MYEVAVLVGVRADVRRRSLPQRLVRARLLRRRRSGLAAAAARRCLLLLLLRHCRCCQG